MNFNEYRARYAELTDDEHRAAYAEWFRLYPSQKCCTLDALRRFLADQDAPRLTVIEVGAWDGWAAGVMLGEFPQIRSWAGIDVCIAAMRDRDYPANYWPLPVMEFRWWRRKGSIVHPNHVVVASHVIEHLSDDDARELLSTLKPRAWYIEAPLTDDGQDWDNYNGSHILRAGWKQLDAWLADAGYAQAWAMGDARSYVRAR